MTTEEEKPFAPSSSYSVYVLVVLLLAYILNFVDRQVLALVAEDVKADMGLTDSQLGWLLGPAFVLFYTIAGLPLARLADMTSRKQVVAVGLVLWSAMTAVCGAAANFPQLLLARFGVGIGEAAGTPPSHSLISDYFPPERRATALGIYGWGIFVGTGFGFVLGGILLEAFNWRTAFYVAGLAGLPVALLLGLTVREPPPGASEGIVEAESPSVKEVMRTLFTRRSFPMLMVAASCQAFLGYTVLSWGATYLRRVFELSGRDAGIQFGLAAAISGAVGVTVGGLLADRLARRDARWFTWISAISSITALPFALGFAWAPTAGLAIAAFIPFYALNNLYVSSLWTLVQNLVSPRMRSTAAATQLGILNIVGLGVGPLVAGYVSQVLEPTYGVDGLRVALTIAAVVGAAAAIFFLLSGRTLRADLERASQKAS
ncbi:MAG: MFS transporter [Candidatus Binatia bacterium]|nr:MFS transporter [Candidatus Binatia bacterium]